MKFSDLVRSHHWLSVELTLLELYPDQQESIRGYENVFEQLKSTESEENDMLIVLSEYDSDSEDGTPSTYIDVSGRKLIPDPDDITSGYAIEFEKWEKWLGMEISPETIREFSELEIVSHCLYEMTFCGYEEEEIQDQFNSIKGTFDEYKSMSPDDKKKNTTSLDDFLKELD